MTLKSKSKSMLQRVLISGLRRRCRCLFVLSTGRCGTTTLAKLLSHVERIESVHEPLPHYLAETANAYETGPEWDPNAFLHDFSRTRFRSLSRVGMNSAEVYAECSNRLTYVANDLAAFFPASRFIHLYRHPADVVRSAMRREYYLDKNLWDHNRIRPRHRSDAAAAWGSWSQFQKCCWYWNAVNEFSLSVVERLGPLRTYSLPAEELFSGVAVSPLLEWLGVSVSSGVEISPEMTNAQEMGDFPKWRDWSSEHREQLRAIAGATSARLGYDLSITSETVRTACVT